MLAMFMWSLLGLVFAFKVVSSLSVDVVFVRVEGAFECNEADEAFINLIS